VSGTDDFEVIAKRQRVTAALTALTDRHRALNHDINARETLQ
jgi:hypothetical protein